jgi:hypothetical protein
MKSILHIGIVFFVFVTLPSFVFADNLEDAHQAAFSGDFKKAHQLWLVEAEEGNANAQYNLGITYSNGQGVPQDDKEAVKWYRLAADQGFKDAQYNLGVMYHHGLGVPQDYKEAVKWYRLAAEQGFANAQYNLGLMYYNGLAVLQSFEDAYAWWVIAAANGHEDARTNMEVAQEGKMTPNQIEKGQQLAKEIWASLGN